MGEKTAPGRCVQQLCNLGKVPHALEVSFLLWKMTLAAWGSSCPPQPMGINGMQSQVWPQEDRFRAVRYNQVTEGVTVSAKRGGKDQLLTENHQNAP